MVIPQSAIPLRHRISWVTLIVFYCILMLITWTIYVGKFSSNVDQLLHDFWVRASERDTPADVVIVAIDSTSLNILGRWPWPRTLQTSLYTRLSKAGVRAIAVDLLYTENDIDLSVDRRLGEAISQFPVVVMPVLTEGRGTVREYIEKLPIPELAKHATALGHIFTPLDSDGLVRRVRLKSGFQAPHWQHLGLALASATGMPAEDLDIPGKRLALPSSERLWIEDYEVLIPFYGPSGSFTTVSVIDVISDRLAKDFLRDKIVLVGSTATGLGDMLPTAVSSINKPMPGVEIHANIFSMLREGTAVIAIDQRVNFFVAATLLAVLLLLYSQLPPLWALVCLSVTTLIPVLLSFVLYRFSHMWYAPLTASIPILISYFVWSWHRLEFLADFLRRETDIISRDLVPLIKADNTHLAQFFKNASRHLPLDGWHFEAQGEEFSGGIVPAKVRVENNAPKWSRSADSYRKSYITKGKLSISVRTSDEKFADEFMDYIDSLSRIKQRQVLSKLSAPLERVQNHTYQLSQQLNRLRQVKVLSESIFAGSPAGLIVWSASGEVVSVNALAISMFPSENIGQITLLDFVKVIGRDPDRLDRPRVDELITERVPWQINQIGQDTELVVNFSAFGGRLVDRLVTASIVDVSDIRRSERSRAEMVDFLSHDLRNPLVSSLYLLKDVESGDGAQQGERFQRIENNINLSLTMINDLLTIARADNLSPDQFNEGLFDSIVDNALDQLSPQARAKRITLDVVTLHDDLWIECDAALVERALVNIISNSIKYSPEDTTITVETGREREHLVFRVADQGVGIAPAMMSSLFQRFKRDKKISQQYKGIGLGLALVFKVVEQHGGTVRAESPGLGTVIVMTLPLAAISA